MDISSPPPERGGMGDFKLFNYFFTVQLICKLRPLFPKQTHYVFVIRRVNLNMAA